MDLDTSKSLFSMIAAGFAAMFAWSAKRNVTHLDETHKNHDTRLQTLEKDRVTRSDVTEISERLNTINDNMNSQHAKILELLIKNK